MFSDDLARAGSFTLTPEEFGRIGSFGFVSGRSTHADRVATIRDTAKRCGVIVDTHTADGLKVAREHRDVNVPMIVLETALPAKFAATIVEALGEEPPRPAALQGIEALPRRCVVMRPDVAAVKDYIAAKA